MPTAPETQNAGPKKALGAVKKGADAPTEPAPPAEATSEAVEADPRPTVIEALSSVAAELPAIGKDETHAQGFSYRSIEGIMRTAGSVLQRHGIVVTPNVRHRDVEQIGVGRDKVWRLVSLEVRFRFYGPRGDYVDAVTVGEGFDPGDKAASKAHTMAYKTALIEVLQIADGDDAERDHHPDAAQGGNRQRPQQRPPTPTPKTPEQIVAELTAEHGAEHASGVQALVRSLNEDFPEETRDTIKREFTDEFQCNPWRITPDDLGRASMWIAGKMPTT